MKISEFLSYLREKNIELWVEGDDLCYRVPKGTVWHDLRAEIIARKQEMIRFLKKRQNEDADGIIRPALRNRDIMLSFSQERLWVLDRLGLGSIAYHICPVFRLAGPLDLPTLQRSLGEIVRRHEALRTTFQEKSGKPVQVIHPAGEFRLDITDLSGLSAAGREAEASRRILAEARRPFDLSEGPLLRASLLRLGEEEHIFSLILHHIIFDGWSIGILFGELSALYRAFRGGGPSPLRELPIQYADFAVWQRRWLQGEVLQSLLSYWKRKLEGAPPVLELPSDRPRPPVQTHQGALESFLVPKPVSEGLKSLSRQEGGTLYIVLLTAFATLLRRYTGQEDIVIGTPIANRNRVEIETLIGFFVNTLVLRTDLSGDPTFRQLLGRVRETTLEAYEHQDLPFEKLVEELQPQRSLSHSPLVQVMFAFQNMPGGGLTLEGLSVTRQRHSGGTAKFDLTLFMTEGQEGLKGTIEYATDLFDAGTIGRMIGHFGTLLEGIAADPDRRISALPLLSEAERHRIVVEWNDTATEYPRDKCIHHLFEEQVERTPDAVAVICGDRSLTYRALNREADRIAGRLRGLGVGRGALVGIFAERSVQMITAMIGILKAGGAYVPLDPSYPADRLHFMTEDAGIQILLSGSTHCEISSSYGGTVIDLEGDQRVTSETAIGRQDSVGSPEDLAYVIYTSGSTGRPKGVCVPHRAIARLVMHTNYIALGPSDVVAHVSNCAFDAATFEIWGALLNGARLVVLGQEVVLSPEDFAGALRREKVSTLFLTTALFNQMAHLRPEAFRTVRNLLFGGEAVDPECVRSVIRAGRPERLLHVYGPTENTTFTSWYQVEDVAGDAVTVPIGRPVSNTRIYLLDRFGNPVPVGVPGELHTAGDGLARGYLNREELTGERFIPDPFAAVPGSLLYRTGDIARYRRDGNIEFLGRKDHQIKIRGFRVELEEIETALATHQAVQSAVVTARQDRPGDTRLVAYVVQRQHVTTEALREFLGKSLPPYMVPSFFVYLDSLPLTPNGKVDRRALPVPGPSSRASEDVFTPPRTSVEKAVSGIWSDLLGIKQIGVKDNFFALGGHSLLATRVIARISEVFRIDMSLRTLFELPTVEGLSALIEAVSGDAQLWGPDRGVPRCRETGEI
jgi:amino acid adenylation domain-containing protein